MVKILNFDLINTGINFQNHFPCVQLDNPLIRTKLEYWQVDRVT